MCGFIMPRPLPPVPPTRAEMQRQREQARLREEAARGRRPYDRQVLDACQKCDTTTRGNR